MFSDWRLEEWVHHVGRLFGRYLERFKKRQHDLGKEKIFPG